MRMLPVERVAALATGIGATLALGAIVWTFVPTPSSELGPRPTPQILSLKGVPIRGDGNAPVVLLVFSDFQCVFCRRLATVILPKIEQEYVLPKRVSIAFRVRPSRMSPVSLLAARLGLCAAERGLFWQFHDAVFATSGLTKDGLVQVSEMVGTPDGLASECASAAEAAVNEDLNIGDALSIEGTPDSFVGIRLPRAGTIRVVERVSGALPTDRFRAALDKALDESAK